LRALVSWGLDLHRDPYEELVVPHLVREETATGTGHLLKFADDMYHTTLDNLWLVPTGEGHLAGLHRDEIFDLADLPCRYMTYSLCLRREAGSAGKDTRGMQRLHEFHKVELVRLCLLENVEREFQELLADAERSVITTTPAKTSGRPGLCESVSRRRETDWLRYQPSRTAQLRDPPAITGSIAGSKTGQLEPDQQILLG